MSDKPSPERPIRVGVFENVEQADAAVSDLLAAGFTKEEITVICSRAIVQRHFKAFEHQDPAGSHTVGAVAIGGVSGAALGGLGAVVLAVAAPLGGAALLIAGSLALWTGGVVGGLVGAMMTRGIERELANFYDQEVENGKILVAAEQTDPARGRDLEHAAQIFAQHGAKSMPLREG
jgi:hypothetical protein